jgi:hypothetical protein
MASAKRFFSGSGDGDENENEKRRKKKDKVEKEKSKPQKTSIENEEDLKARSLAILTNKEIMVEAFMTDFLASF